MLLSINAKCSKVSFGLRTVANINFQIDVVLRGGMTDYRGAGMQISDTFTAMRFYNSFITVSLSLRTLLLPLYDGIFPPKF